MLYYYHMYCITYVLSHIFFDPLQFEAGNAMNQPRKHFCLGSILEQVRKKGNMPGGRNTSRWAWRNSCFTYMSFSSQRAEKSLERRDELSGGCCPPHLYITEPPVICWQRIDPAKTLGTSDSARSQDEQKIPKKAPPAHRLMTRHEIWKPHRRLGVFPTNRNGNTLVHFCVIYKRYKDKQLVCHVKRLQAHTLLVLLSFENKLPQNLGEGVLKHRGVIWPSLNFTEHLFKILEVFLSNWRNVFLLSPTLRKGGRSMGEPRCPGHLSDHKQWKSKGFGPAAHNRQ